MADQRIQDFTNSQLSVIAVYLLGGAVNAVEMEDVGVKLFEMTPGRFSLHKHPDYLDIHSVRVALSNAERLEPHHLAGSIKNGYMLTKKGLEWIEAIESDENLSGFQDKSRKGSISEFFEIERDRLRQTSAYQLYSKNQLKAVSRKDLFDFLRVNEYFPKRKVLEKIQFVENAIEGDEILGKLWHQLQELFEEELKSYDNG